MKKLTLLTTAFAIFMGVQMLAPNKSEAQITCSTDFYAYVVWIAILVTILILELTFMATITLHLVTALQ